jgi:hypothetical protein
MVFHEGEGVEGEWLQFFGGRKTREQGREENERGGRKEKKSERKSRYVFLLFFSQGSCVLPATASASLYFFFSSLSAIAKRPNLDAAREFPRCSCPLKSPQIRQLDSFHRPI